MPIMTWDKSLDIGVAAMNKEHRDILDAMNKIFDAHGAGQKGDAINRLVAALGSVCVKHFADEERFMAEIGFPGLGAHKLIHEKLLEDFAKHAAAIKAANGTANDEFFGFLKRWLVAHIKGIDAKYGEHANRKASVA
jgi:hemerythrin-like metal-binding protein